MSFANSQQNLIIGSSFTEIHGSQHNIHHDHGHTYVSVQQRADIAIHTLYAATSKDAAYDSVGRKPAPVCHPGTRMEPIDRIQSWITDREENNMMWFHGPAGAGKSAIAQTICESAAERGQLLASFFFSRSSSDRNTIAALFSTIAYQIVLSSPASRATILDVIAHEPSIVNRPISVQLDKLIVQPLLRAAALNPASLIVIDGLDECGTSSERAQIVRHACDLVQTPGLSLRILILSRPEPDILHAFNNLSQNITIRISLYDDYRALDDVYTYLRAGFDEIRESERHSSVMVFMPKPWPPNDEVQLLADRSEGYFVYASTVIKYIGEEYFMPPERLRLVLDRPDSAGSAVFAELDRLYSHILSLHPNTCLLLSILGFLHIDVNLRPGLSCIEVILHLQPGEAESALRGMHSVLRLQYIVYSRHYDDLKVATASRDDSNSGIIYNSDFQIRPIHKSFTDFLFDKERSKTYCIDKQAFHDDIFRHILPLFRNCYPLWESSRNKLLDVIFDVLPNILRGIEDASKNQLAEAICEAVPENAWKHLFEAMLSWPKPVRVSCFLWVLFFGDLFEGIPGLLPDLIDRIYSLLLLDIRTYFFLESDTDIQAVKYMHILQGTQAATRSFLEYSMGCAIKDTWDEYRLLMAGFFGLHKFLEDRERCGGLHYPLDIWNACVAHHCLDILGGTAACDELTREYATQWWAYHLIRSTPGNPGLLCLLRNLPPQNGCSWKTHSVDVLDWLKKIPNPPKDLLSRWKKIYKGKEDIGPKRKKSALQRFFPGLKLGHRPKPNPP